jgi:hypothetical protein
MSGVGRGLLAICKEWTEKNESLGNVPGQNCEIRDYQGAGSLALVVNRSRRRINISIIPPTGHSSRNDRHPHVVHI